MVSTDRRPVNGKNRGIGLRLKQAASYLDDILLQHISQDFKAISFYHSKVTAGSRASPAPETNTKPSTGPTEERSTGRGFTLDKKSGLCLSSAAI